MAQAASKSCEICAAALGEYLCHQCDQLFCRSCKSSHLKAKISKNHVFLHGPNINQEVKLRCEEHDELFIYQCLGCDTPVCGVCVVKKHNGHSFAALKDYTDGLKTKVNKKIVTTLETLKANNASLGQGTAKYQQEIEAVIRSITEEGARLKHLIDKKVADLIQSVKNEGAEQLQILSTMEEDFQKSLRLVTEYRNQLDSLQGPVTGDINKKINQLKADVDKLKVPDHVVMPSVSYRQKGAREKDMNQLFGSLFTTEVKQRPAATRVPEEREVKQRRPDTRVPEKQQQQSGKYLYRCLNCRTEQRSYEKPT